MQSSSIYVVWKSTIWSIWRLGITMFLRPFFIHTILLNPIYTYLILPITGQYKNSTESCFCSSEKYYNCSSSSFTFYQFILSIFFSVLLLLNFHFYGFDFTSPALRSFNTRRVIVEELWNVSFLKSLDWKLCFGLRNPCITCSRSLCFCNMTKTSPKLTSTTYNRINLESFPVNFKTSISLLKRSKRAYWRTPMHYYVFVVTRCAFDENVISLGAHRIACYCSINYI